MKLLIVGSRSICNFDLSSHIPPEVDLIISGGANGIDRLAEEYADQHRISKLILRPQYNRFGKAAPLKRNESMVDLSDSVLVIWDGASKGTQHTIHYADKANKSIRVITVDKKTEEVP